MERSKVSSSFNLSAGLVNLGTYIRATSAASLCLRREGREVWRARLAKRCFENFPGEVFQVSGVCHSLGTE